MSVKYVETEFSKYAPEFFCDGPKHEGDTLMQYDTLVLEHGYGSPYDGDEHHFCSLRCLAHWAKLHKHFDIEVSEQ